MLWLFSALINEICYCNAIVNNMLLYKRWYEYVSWNPDTLVETVADFVSG